MLNTDIFTTSFVLSHWWVFLLLLLTVLALISLFRRGPDIEWGKPEDLNLKWDEEDDSLGKIFDYVVQFSDNTIKWYQTRRQPKRRFGVSLRLGALLLTVAAGFVPLSAGLKLGSIPAVWSTVMLATAGVFVSIDLLVGSTSGWVRYMLAQQQVERLRDAFVMDWNALKLAKTDTAGKLERAKTFLLAVGKVVDDETQEWATEFRNALKEMEKARRKAAELERTGAIEVTVKNPAAVGEWILEIDGSDRGRTSGKNLAVIDVPVGIRKLKAYGEDSHGKKLSDEKTVKVEGGATLTKELELT